MFQDVIGTVVDYIKQSEDITCQMVKDVMETHYLKCVLRYTGSRGSPPNASWCKRLKRLTKRLDVPKYQAPRASGY